MIKNTIVRNIYDFDERIKFIKSLPSSAVLLDIGCGSGDVIRKFLEYRPDLSICGIDIIDQKIHLPENINFSVVNAEKDRLPFPDNYFDAVSMIHVIEHLESVSKVFSEINRVLKPRSSFYFETPAEKSINIPRFTMFFPDKTGGPLNFFDDTTHKKPWEIESLRGKLSDLNFNNLAFGTYRNMLYALLSPVLILAGLFLRRRRFFVVGVHHLIGWSIYCRGKKKAE
jgi:SAM-dependent methyltransferase